MLIVKPLNRRFFFVCESSLRNSVSCRDDDLVQYFKWTVCESVKKIFNPNWLLTTEFRYQQNHKGKHHIYSWYLFPKIREHLQRLKSCHDVDCIFRNAVLLTLSKYLRSTKSRKIFLRYFFCTANRLQILKWFLFMLRMSIWD